MHFNNAVQYSLKRWALSEIFWYKNHNQLTCMVEIPAVPCQHMSVKCFHSSWLTFSYKYATCNKINLLCFNFSTAFDVAVPVSFQLKHAGVNSFTLTNSTETYLAWNCHNTYLMKRNEKKGCKNRIHFCNMGLSKCWNPRVQTGVIRFYNILICKCKFYCHL